MSLANGVSCEKGKTSPAEEDALEAVSRLTGMIPRGIRRFTTGNHHFVFEVQIDGMESVVARLASPDNRSAMEGAVQLSSLLRPLGVPLPRMLASDLESTFPCIILERFPGTDLGHVFRRLSKAELTGVAMRLAEAQSVVSSLSFDGPARFGYATAMAEAPHSTWWENVAEDTRTARAMLLEAGGDASVADKVMDLAEALKRRLDEITPVPFLHDTTTKNVIVADGRFQGIVDVDSLCFGDPRLVKSLTMAALMSQGLPGAYVEDWLVLSGETMDEVFWLYVASHLCWFLGEHVRSLNGNVAVPTTSEAEMIKRALLRAMDLARPKA